MKIWSTPHSDMGRPVNYNGPKVECPDVPGRCPSMRRRIECSWLCAGTPEYPAVLASFEAVIIRPVRAISRKGQVLEQWLSARRRAIAGEKSAEQLGSWNPQRPYANRLSPTLSRRYGPDPIAIWGIVPSEIPCRVSSDLHEWRNDLATVSTRDPAKLHDE